MRQPQLHRPEVLGLFCIALATAALATAWLALDEWGHPQSLVGRILIQLGLLIAAGSAIAAIFVRRRPTAWIAPGLFWLALLAVGVAEGVRAVSLTAAVEPSEALVVVLAIAASVSGARSRLLAMVVPAAAAAMLVLFGAIHLLYPAAISGLVPAWVPLRHLIPYFTGSLQIAAGFAFASSRARPIAAIAVALLFLSWLPLVHFERLAREPASLWEWRFALTALALAGALLIGAKGRSGRLEGGSALR